MKSLQSVDKRNNARRMLAKTEQGPPPHTQYLPNITHLLTVEATLFKLGALQTGGALILPCPVGVSLPAGVRVPPDKTEELLLLRRTAEPGHVALPTLLLLPPLRVEVVVLLLSSSSQRLLFGIGERASVCCFIVLLLIVGRIAVAAFVSSSLYFDSSSEEDGCGESGMKPSLLPPAAFIALLPLVFFNLHAISSIKINLSKSGCDYGIKLESGTPDKLDCWCVWPSLKDSLISGAKDGQRRNL